MSSAYQGGPHELGQNNLTSRSVIHRIDRLAARTTGPIVELGAGDGALTMRLAQRRRPLTAVELDPDRAQWLRARTPANVAVVNADLTRFRFPTERHTVVGNLPFHLTTVLLRRLFAAQHWHSAILLVQWEVARRRAGVGGASMLTAQWWPW